MAPAACRAQSHCLDRTPAIGKHIRQDRLLPETSIGVFCSGASFESETVTSPHSRSVSHPIAGQRDWSMLHGDIEGRDWDGLIDQAYVPMCVGVTRWGHCWGWGPPGAAAGAGALAAWRRRSAGAVTILVRRLNYACDPHPTLLVLPCDRRQSLQHAMTGLENAWLRTPADYEFMTLLVKYKMQRP